MARSRPTHSELLGEVADLLHDVNRLIRRRAREDGGAEGLTAARMRALRVLAHRREPVMMSDLAGALDIARRSATSVVDELEARGLVERTSAIDDRRAVLVGLTAAGRGVLADERRRRRALAAGAIDVLSVAELETLRTVLSRVTSARTSC